MLKNVAETYRIDQILSILPTNLHLMENYRDNFYGSILDPLHGDIKLSEIEKWCLSSPIFSRLRYVKQNTFLYYVFPSANHTRFEHSIGVMDMAGRIFDCCKENYTTGEKKKEKYGITSKSFFDLNALGDKEPVYYQELRLAALLHDVGHGPMSHLFDEFSISSEAFLKIIEKDAVTKKYYNGFNKILAQKATVEHEIVSCLFIFRLIHELKETSNAQKQKFTTSSHEIIKQLHAERIVKMIAPEFTELTESSIDLDGNNYSRFFSKIITAFPIDADRMDYLIRDSYFSGVTYGIYDLNRIFASFQAKCEDKIVDLVYKQSGIDSMLRFIQSRTHLYNQVYFHKTNRAVNTMLTYATKSIKDKEKILDRCKSVEELINFYVNNSDEFFVKQTISEKIDGIEKEVLKELIERKLFKRVYEKKIVLTGNAELIQAKRKEIEAIKILMRKKLEPLDNNRIFSMIDYYENKTFKDASAAKNIGLAKKVPGSDYTIEYDWTKAGKEFALSDMVLCMIRIYIRRNFATPAEYKRMNSEVRTAVQSEIVKLDGYDG